MFWNKSVQKFQILLKTLYYFKFVWFFGFASTKSCIKIFHKTFVIWASFFLFYVVRFFIGEVWASHKRKTWKTCFWGSLRHPHILRDFSPFSSILLASLSLFSLKTFGSKHRHKVMSHTRFCVHGFFHAKIWLFLICNIGQKSCKFYNPAEICKHFHRK